MTKEKCDWRLLETIGRGRFYWAQMTLLSAATLKDGQRCEIFLSV